MSTRGASGVDVYGVSGADLDGRLPRALSLAPARDAGTSSSHCFLDEGARARERQGQAARLQGQVRSHESTFHLRPVGCR